MHRERGEEGRVVFYLYIFLNAYKIDLFLNNKNYPKLTQEEIENLKRPRIRGRNLNYKIIGNIQIILLANSTKSSINRLYLYFLNCWGEGSIPILPTKSTYFY